MPPKKGAVNVTKSDNTKALALEKAKECSRLISAAKTDPMWHKYLSSGSNPAKIRELQYGGDASKLHDFIIQKSVEFKGGQKSVPYTEFFYNKKRLK